jgi:N-acetylglucosamine-6-phosphate deacetylase
MTTSVASASVCTPDSTGPGWLALDAGTIVEVGHGSPPRDALDLADRVVAPGFVDLQCNGIGAIDFATSDPEDWRRAQRALARRGVTAICPTFVTAPLDAYDAMLAATAAASVATPPDGAALVGAHLEGPFLGGALGAHDASLVRAADVAWLLGLLARHEGLVRVVTLAPEADPGSRATTALVAAGVVVALGHTTASFEEALAAADAGATVVTHLFNGMASLHHRDPGVAGAALTDDRLTPTMIADFVHVHPAVLALAFAATTVATVSDSVSSAGVVERDGAAWLVDGTLAGATTQLDGALANLCAAGIDPERAIASLTAVPARLLGLADRGVLRDGAVADVVALDPETLAVERVWLRGEEIACTDR